MLRCVEFPAVTSECSVVVLAASSFLTGGEGAGAEGSPPVHNYQYKDSRLSSQLPLSSQGEKEQGLRGRHLYTTISIRIADSPRSFLLPHRGRRSRG